MEVFPILFPLVPWLWVGNCYSVNQSRSNTGRQFENHLHWTRLCWWDSILNILMETENGLCALYRISQLPFCGNDCSNKGLLWCSWISSYRAKKSSWTDGFFTVHSGRQWEGWADNKWFQESSSFKDLWPFADILIDLKRLPTLIKNVFNLCLICYTVLWSLILNYLKEQIWANPGAGVCDHFKLARSHSGDIFVCLFVFYFVFRALHLLLSAWRGIQPCRSCTTEIASSEANWCFWSNFPQWAVVEE